MHCIISIYITIVISVNFLKNFRPIAVYITKYGYYATYTVFMN